MEPPEPLQKTLELLKTLPNGDYLRVYIKRDPVFLYPLLVTDEFSYKTRRLTESGYEILIWHKGDDIAEQVIHATG